MNPNPKTHTLSTRPDGKIRVTNDAKKQKQSSSPKTWQTMSTAAKLDMLAETTGLIDANGNLIPQ